MEEYLSLDVRRKLYFLISKSPGLHFREIQRRMKLATGSLDYHLHFLQKNSLVRTEKESKFVRYYVTAQAVAEEEREMLNILRNNHIRHILIYIIEHKNSNAADIANGLGFSPSRLSPYLKHLIEKNILMQKKKGRFRYYKIRDPEKIVKYLIMHKSSFLDEMVDRFIDAWTT